MRLRSISLLLSIAACSSDPAEPGTRGGPCYGNGTCNGELACNADRVCEPPRASDAGPVDGDAGTPQPDAGSPDAAGADTGPAADAGVADASSGDAGPLVYPPPAGCFRASPTIRELGVQSMIVGPGGELHAAVGGDALYYAFLPAGGASFVVERVDDHGGPASILLDNDGRPAIAYWDRFARHAPLADEIEGLKLARRDPSGAWTVHALWPEHPRISPTVDDSRAPAFVQGGDGVFSFAYAVPSATGADLGLARWDGATLQQETYTQFPADTYVRGGQIEAALAGGEPIFAVGTGYTHLWLVRRAMGAWRDPELVSHAVASNLEWSFFVDSADRPGFVLRGMTTQQHVQVWRQTAVGWDVVDCTPTLPIPIGGIYRAGLLGDGTPAFLTYDFSGGGGNYHLATVAVGSTCDVERVVQRDYPSGQWVLTEPIDRVDHAALAFAAGGPTRAALQIDAAAGRVIAHVSHDDGASYTTLPVIDTAVHGLSPAIALAADGAPLIAAVEGARGGLELASWNEARGAFDVESVPVGAAGCRVESATLGAVSVLVHATGDVLIAYERTCPGGGVETVLSRKAPFGWTQEALPAQAEPPLELLHQPDGRPALATPHRYFEYDGAVWVEVDTPINPAGEAEPALAYDELGRAVFAIAERNDVSVSRRDAGGMWTTDRIDTLSTYVDYPRYPISVAIDPTGVWHVAYGRYVESPTRRYYPAPNEVRLARRDANGWTVETIDTISADHVYTPIAGIQMQLDGDRPVLAYRHHRDSTLVLAAPDGMGGFTRRVLASDGDTGLYPALAVRGGVAHVAFHHAGTGDLCYLNAPVP